MFIHQFNLGTELQHTWLSVSQISLTFPKIFYFFLNIYRNVLGWAENLSEPSCIRMWRCPWSNGYRRRKWTRRHELKSWTRLTASHIALGKVWLQLFSVELWMNRRVDWVLQPWWGNQSRRKKPVKLHLKIDLVSHPTRAEGVDKYIHIWMCFQPMS